MRLLSYIWAAVSFDTPWAMGRTDVQLMAWGVGFIAPVLLAVGLHFGFQKTVVVLGALLTVLAASMVIYWLVTMDYWIHAPLPTDCGRDACDNDGTIRVLFAAGAVLLPAIIPSLFAGPLAILIAVRRFATQKAVAA